LMVTLQAWISKQNQMHYRSHIRLVSAKQSNHG
jgi:hypothetical protein